MGWRENELTERLTGVWRSGKPLTAQDAIRLAPDDDLAAYAVQDAVAASLDWFPQRRARAWKISSVPPTAAPVPDAFIVDAPADATHRIRREDFHTLIGVEVELVLRLDRMLPTGTSECEAAEAIAGVFAAIEIFDVRAQDWRTLPRTFLLADHQMHGRLLLGTGIETGWKPSFSHTEVCLCVNGAEKLRRRGGHALETPVAILPWLANHVAARGEALRAGDLVASGTWTGVYEVQPGEHIHAAFEGIGDVSLEVDVP